jgi:serine/threonine protein kinase
MDFNFSGILRKLNGKSTKIAYYVMNYAEYGELYRLIEVNPLMSEKTARFFFRKLVRSVDFIHNNNCAHRDIKTENVLVDSNFNVLLCDFGSCCSLLDKSEDLRNDTFGSPDYNPPEVNDTRMNYPYDPVSSDVFSLGISLFLMVMKSKPFKVASRSDPYYKRLISANSANFWKISESTRQPSESFKNLIECMLQEDPLKRITLAEIKKHSWYMDENQSIENLKTELTDSISHNSLELTTLARNQIKKVSESSHFTPCKLVSYHSFGNNLDIDTPVNRWLKEMEIKFNG